MSHLSSGSVVSKMSLASLFRRIPLTMTMIAVGFLASEATNAAMSSEIDFANEVLPILSDKCFVCHGPDTFEETSLKLDSFDGATADLGGYRAIDPENLDNSEMLHRVFSEDDPMPPEDAQKQLTAREKEVLEAWVLSGGAYSTHWAFVRPTNTGPTLPKHQAIDHFVGEKLAQAGASLATEADRTTLARRVSLVLTGLPPSVELLNRYLEDDRPDAYARLVDELLESPRFGEHQARYWLDAVRYGDTHGLHLDNRRGIYPYRDWVVRAFNQNLPLDDFIRWQLAGDLLPQPSMDQTVATGFVRMNPSTAEGGAIAQEFQAKNNFDRTETLGTVLLGMTLTCSRCHTHKYDPITQTEYYQLFAFFNSTAEHSMDGNAYEYGPVARAPKDQASWDQWQQLRNLRQTLLSEIRENASQATNLKAYALKASQFRLGKFLVSPSLPKGTDRPPLSEWTEVEALTPESKIELTLDDSVRHVRFQVKNDVDQTLRLTHPGSSIVDGRVEGLDEVEVVDSQLRLPAGTHEVELTFKGVQKDQTLTLRLDTPWKEVSSKPFGQLPEDLCFTLAADLMGPLADKQLVSKVSQYLQDEKVAESRFTTTLVAKELPNPRDTFVLRRGEYNLPVGEPLVPDVPAIMGALPENAPRNRLGLANWLTSPENPLVSRVVANQLWQRVFGLGIVRTPEDFGVQGERPTHPRLLDWLAIQLRDHGWDQKEMLRTMVLSRTFRQSSARRPDLKDPENRLFARGPRYRLDAEVLRDIGLWSSGLLDPTQGGEGVKPYQPDGMWLAMAHPGSNTKKYQKDQGDRLYRRSLYVYWKRTSPHPMMTLFDAPDRESSCVQRSRTTTALQSLGLLNETQRIEMSRKLAERLIQSSGDEQARLEKLFLLLASRKPQPLELDACLSLLEQMKTRYRETPDDAAALLATGDSPHDDSIDSALAAAWTQVCCTVMASDLAILLY